MAFMVPEYLYGRWAECEDNWGETNIVPADMVEEATDVVRYRYGWGCRLSAPGYLDCTDWTVFDTEEEARDHIEEMYDVDPDTGEDII